MALKHCPVAARRAERGAALFIVMLIVTLLTAIGVFAAHATSLAQTAAGASRRAAIALHLAEFAVGTVAADMSDEPQKYDEGRTAAPGQCPANVGVNAKFDQCVLVSSEDAKVFLAPDVVTDATGALFGVLSADAAVDAAFQVQVHEWFLSAEITAGMSATTTKTWETTVTTTGRILPASALANQCDADLTRASENLSIRSYISYTSTGGS
jgi:Tfp pilus assembly protein PilX